MTLHIGILAHSAEGATLCYRTVWMEGIRRMGPHNHPEITVTGIAFRHTIDAWERDDRPALRSVFLADAQKLAAAGADFFVLPDNTAHIALETPGEPFPIPGLHIAEVVADQAQREGRKRVGIEGSLKVNRFDYGLKWNRITEAVQVVADDVKIELNVEANTPRQSKPAAN